MKLSVPSRFELELIDDLNKINKRYGTISKIYGSLPYSIIGHGRFSNLVLNYGNFNFSRVKDFAEKAHSVNIDVNYLANSLCLGDLGYDKSGYKKVTKYFSEVYDSGADIVTVSSPYLLRILKKEFPSLKVEVSVHAHVDSVQKFLRWEKFGADIINIPGSSNRNFEFLEAISDINGVAVELLVNESCLYDCAYALYHHTLSSHRSKEPVEGLDYCMMECVNDRANSPAEILRAPWIRPEDLSFYEKSFKINKFKLQGRQMNIEWILKTSEAYSKRSHDGNFLDLISPTYPDWSSRFQTIKDSHNIHKYRKPDVFIDNYSLDQFFKLIIQKGGCKNISNCYICGLCEKMAKDLIKFRNSEDFDSYRESTKMLRNNILKF